VSVGCKIYVQRPLETGEVEERKAEVLSVRDKSQSLYGATSSSSSSPAPEDRLEYYIHWVDFNKRLDEWIPGSRLILSKELEWPKPKVPGSAGKAGKKDGGAQPGKVARNPSLLKKATSQAASSRATPLPGTPQKRKGGYDDSQPDTPGVSQQDTPNQTQDDMMDLDEDAIGEEDTTLLSPVDPRKPTATFSKEQEIEKLRHSGSMTQSVHEIARVKNLNRLQIGGHIVEAWYFSPYPSEYAHVPILFICEFCLSYFPQKGMYGRHREKCRLLHPPGNEIYRYQDISFFEIDGRRQLIWCRNLSLLSKCFLDQYVLMVPRSNATLTQWYLQ
jgi:histone acetyltransferase HTATIP